MAAPPPVAAPAPRQTPVTVITDSLVLVSPPVAASVAPSVTEWRIRYAPDPPTPTVADAWAWVRLALDPKEAACLLMISKAEDPTQDPTAANRSGAYGLPQAKPGDKMAAFGTDWRRNPVTQLEWMAWYVKDRYGSACQAAMFELGWWYKGVWHPGAGWY